VLATPLKILVNSPQKNLLLNASSLVKEREIITEQASTLRFQHNMLCLLVICIFSAISMAGLGRAVVKAWNDILPMLME
jgi:hypothetical protein